MNFKFRSYIKPWWCVLHEKLRFYNNKIILVLKFVFIYSYYYGEKVFITNCILKIRNILNALSSEHAKVLHVLGV